MPTTFQALHGLLALLPLFTSQQQESSTLTAATCTQMTARSERIDRYRYLNRAQLAEQLAHYKLLLHPSEEDLAEEAKVQQGLLQRDIEEGQELIPVSRLWRDLTGSRIDSVRVHRLASEPTGRACALPTVFRKKYGQQSRVTTRSRFVHWVATLGPEYLDHCMRVQATHWSKKK